MSHETNLFGATSVGTNLFGATSVETNLFETTSAGTVSASKVSAGTVSAGTVSAGTNLFGTNSASQAVGTNSASQAVGTNSAGTVSAGTVSAGTTSAGTNLFGTNLFGTNLFGTMLQVPSDYFDCTDNIPSYYQDSDYEKLLLCYQNMMKLLIEPLNALLVNDIDKMDAYNLNLEALLWGIPEESSHDFKLKSIQALELALTQPTTNKTFYQIAKLFFNDDSMRIVEKKGAVEIQHYNPTAHFNLVFYDQKNRTKGSVILQQANSLKKNPPKESLPKENPPKENPLKKNPPKESLPKESLPKESLPKESLPKESLLEENPPKGTKQYHTMIESFENYFSPKILFQYIASGGDITLLPIKSRFKKLAIQEGKKKGQLIFHNQGYQGFIKIIG